MSRQAVARRPFPSARSPAIRLADEHNLARIPRSDDVRSQIYQEHNRVMAKMLGLEIQKQAEMDSRYQIDWNQRYRLAAFAAKTKNGDDIIISNSALKGDAEKARKRGDQYLGQLMLGAHPELFSRSLHKCHLPEHVRMFMKAEGLNPDAIEALIALTKSMEFTYKQVVYSFRATYDAEARERRDQYNYARPGIWNYEIAKIQINLPGQPKVRLIGKGVSIATDIPQSLIIGLTGKKVSDVIPIPGIENLPIRRAAMMGSSKILHLILTDQKTRSKRKAS